MNARNFVGICLASLVLTGCISPKSFVDPSFPKVSYEDLKRKSEPLRLKLVVEFQRNGQPFRKVDSTLKDNAERVLRGSGVVTPVDDQGVGEIKIVLNNIADTSEAVKKGIGTGLTFGLVGSTVTDAYEMSVTINAGGKTITRTAVRHALHTAIGNTSLPPGIEGLPPNVAFGRVLEQMLLRVLQDMQNSGELTSILAPAPVASLKWHWDL